VKVENIQGSTGTTRKFSLKVEDQLRVVLVITIIAFLGFTKTLAAEEFSSAFDAANKLYEQGKFPDAAASYEKIIQSGSVSPAIYFNLGNAFFKSSHIGEAIAAYRKAEQLAPRDPDVQANLQFARNQIQGPTLAPNRWHRWLGRMSLNEWSVISMMAFWLCLLSLAAMQIRPAWKVFLRDLAMGSGLVTVALGVCLANVWTADATPRIIVTSRATAVQSGPLDEAKSVFTVHDGAELVVIDTKDDWLQVSAGPNNGWLKKGQGIVTSFRQTK
jgi:hypothetical protein